MSDVSTFDFDVAVVGSGPAGISAAVHAAHAGRSVVIIEREVSIGGSCVHRGTIPSKTLRETALSLANFVQRSGNVFTVQVREDLQVSSLMTRMEQVVKAHEKLITGELRQCGAVRWHGRASFVNGKTLEIQTVDGGRRRVRADVICIATGSRPRTPENVAVDHENILDSDSILSMIYLPRSLAVLGGGVIASEYASIFAALGVQVTMIDSKPRPLAFLDPELSERFLDSFAKAGGTYLGGRRVESAKFDGAASCEVVLDSGESIRAEKVLCALGRGACLDGLAIEKAGVERTANGLVAVDADLATTAPGIYAIGDVIGPPSLASTSLEQGRLAITHALGLEDGSRVGRVPMGIYTIPEISSVGLTEAEATERFGSCLVGRAGFDQVARGQIGGITDGLLKLVADPNGRKLLGIQIVGEGASDLIHVGQMALLAGFDVDVFIANTFNFPTLAEAYRLAALEIAFARRTADVPSPTS
jgi:NAD(P) transhydrogenase